MLRNSETGTKHLLIRRHQPDSVNIQLSLSIARTLGMILGRDLVPNPVRDALADVHMLNPLILAIRGEAVDMDQRQAPRGVRVEE